MRTVRNLLFSLHKWIGLHFAIFFGFMFVTGAVLVFADEIETVFYPQVWVGAAPDDDRASFGSIYDAVLAADTDASIRSIEISPRPGLADRAYIRDGDGKQSVVWTHPADAKVLAISPRRGLHSILLELHESLMIPKRVGFLLVSATSLVLLAAVLTGLITYRRFWRGYFRWQAPTGDTRAHWSGRHRFLAVWTAPFLLIGGLTGFFFFLTGLGFNGVVPQLPAPSERAEVLPTGFRGEHIDQALGTIRNAHAGFDVRNLILPSRAKQALIFAGYLDSPAILGRTQIAVDPANLTIIGMTHPSDRRGNARIGPVANALHYGTWGGTATRVLWSVFGILSAYLLWTGSRNYLARTRPDATDADPALRRYWRGLTWVRFAYVATLTVVTLVIVVRLFLGR